MWGSYLSFSGGGRSGRRIPFWCNLGRALTLWETQSSQVIFCNKGGIHVMVTMTRAGRFWIMKWSMLFHSLCSTSLRVWWYVKLTSEVKEKETVWSCRRVSDRCDPSRSYCNLLRLFNPCKENRSKLDNIQYSSWGVMWLMTYLAWT